MIRTAIKHFVTVLLSEPNNTFLLLERGQDKRLFPGQWTGIGGAMEVADGQLESVEKCALREMEEETGYRPSDISNLQLRLVTSRVEDGFVTLIFWVTGRVLEKRTPFCPEGNLYWVSASQLADRPFIPSAAVVIPWLAQLEEDDHMVYEGLFQRTDGKITGLSVSPAERFSLPKNG